MNPQTMLTLCQIVTLIASILTGLGGYGIHHYKKKIDDDKQKANKVINVNPVIDFKIDLQKILTIENNGVVDIEDIKIFLTRYAFDEALFIQKKLKIKDYNKIGGTIKRIFLLKSKIGREKIDLKEISSITFYENPGKRDNTPMLTYYCLRVTFRKAITRQQFIRYIITSSYKNYPSLIENQETTASSGNWGDYMLEIPKILKQHQMTLYNDSPEVGSLE